MTQPVTPTDANSIQFGALGSNQALGTLRQVSLHDWKEDSVKDGRDRFSLTETGRDQWSIYLFDLSRKVSLQVDLFAKVIWYSDPKRRQQYQITTSSSRASGWLANRVECGGAAATGTAFKQVSAAGWTEDKPDGTVAFTFNETGRDDWSVYLQDPSRNVAIQLDLFRLMTVYQEAGGAKRDLYPVVSALTKVNGWLVNRIDYTDGGSSIAGSFVQTGLNSRRRIATSGRSICTTPSAMFRCSSICSRRPCSTPTPRHRNLRCIRSRAPTSCRGSASTTARPSMS
jgi:hypothetical protein